MQSQRASKVKARLEEPVEVMVRREVQGDSKTGTVSVLIDGSKVWAAPMSAVSLPVIELEINICKVQKATIYSLEIGP